VFSVVEPDGKLRTVTYTADEWGFKPTITYSGGHPVAGPKVAHHHGYAPGAPVFVQKQPALVVDKRVKFVNKLVGPPPALNVQPFALPAPSAPLVVVPQPLKVAKPVTVPVVAAVSNYAAGKNTFLIAV